MEKWTIPMAHHVCVYVYDCRPCLRVSSTKETKAQSSKLCGWLQENTIGFNEILIEVKVCGQSAKWHITSFHTLEMQIRRSRVFRSPIASKLSGLARWFGFSPVPKNTPSSNDKDKTHWKWSDLNFVHRAKSEDGMVWVCVCGMSAMQSPHYMALKIKRNV